MSTVFTIGIFLSIFLAALLLSKRNKAMSDNILAIFMGAIAIYMGNYYLKYLGYWETHPHLVGTTHPFPLLFGPLLYLYVEFSLRSEQRWKWTDWMHFLPFIISYLLMIPFLFGTSAQEKILSDNQDFDSDYQLFFIATFIAFIISTLLYPFLAFKKTIKYQQIIDDNFAYKEEISLTWLKSLIIGLWGIFVVVIIIVVLNLGFNVQFGFNSDLIGYVLMVVFIFLLGFFGIRHQGIFTEKGNHKQDIVEVKTESYQKSGLKLADAEDIHEKLLQLMQSDKPFLEPKLSLGQLADKLGVTSNNLSQVINQCEEMNFYDFINGYRVKEFITLATSPENRNMNLLGIAFDSGFNSKSSFNQVFKKNTGKTPREYLSVTK
jgi:AraC-like DNA-binding protein